MKKKSTKFNKKRKKLKSIRLQYEVCEEINGKYLMLRNFELKIICCSPRLRSICYARYAPIGKRKENRLYIDQIARITFVFRCLNAENLFWL